MSAPSSFCVRCPCHATFSTGLLANSALALCRLAHQNHHAARFLSSSALCALRAERSKQNAAIAGPTKSCLQGVCPASALAQAGASLKPTPASPIVTGHHLRTAGPALLQACALRWFSAATIRLTCLPAIWTLRVQAWLKLPAFLSLALHTRLHISAQPSPTAPGPLSTGCSGCNTTLHRAAVRVPCPKGNLHAWSGSSSAAAWALWRSARVNSSPSRCPRRPLCAWWQRDAKLLLRKHDEEESWLPLWFG